MSGALESISSTSLVRHLLYAEDLYGCQTVMEMVMGMLVESNQHRGRRFAESYLILGGSKSTRYWVPVRKSRHLALVLTL